MSADKDREPSGSQAEIGDSGPRSSGVVKHSLVVAGHRTSVSLEHAFWDALKSIAQQEGVSLAALVARVDAARGDANLSSALRMPGWPGRER